MNIVVPPEVEQTIIARERMRILSWGFYICGGLGAVFSVFMILYVVMLGAMSFIPASEWDSPPRRTASPSAESEESGPAPSERHQGASSVAPVMIFRVMAGVMAFFVACGFAFAGFTMYAGRCLQLRKNKPLIYVMAALNIIWIPHGTLLGIGTFLTLGSKAAKDEFKPRSEPPGPPR